MRSTVCSRRLLAQPKSSSFGKSNLSKHESGKALNGTLGPEKKGEQTSEIKGLNPDKPFKTLGGDDSGQMGAAQITFELTTHLATKNIQRLSVAERA